MYSTYAYTLAVSRTRWVPVDGVAFCRANTLTCDHRRDCVSVEDEYSRHRHHYRHHRLKKSRNLTSLNRIRPMTCSCGICSTLSMQRNRDVSGTRTRKYSETKNGITYPWTIFSQHPHYPQRLRANVLSCVRLKYPQQDSTYQPPYFHHLVMVDFLQ